VRGGFEYQGQKCSAASRVYAPSNLWPQIREALETEVPTIRMGPVEDFRNFMGAVIDGAAFSTQADAIAQARKSDDAEIVVGGDADDSEGYFVSPTVISTKDPGFDLMQRELFGPVVTAYVYDEKRYDETLEIVNSTSPYALTGSVFATERPAIERATMRCVTRPATSTSTTSPPAPWSASSRSAGAVPRAPTTRPARCGT